MVAVGMERQRRPVPEVEPGFGKGQIKGPRVGKSLEDGRTSRAGGKAGGGIYLSG